MDARDLLPDATSSLVRDVDTLDADALAAPSTLPGWSRAHVVAHVALNAEGLVRALGGLVHGSDVPQYDSSAAREADITELAAADAEELRARFLASCTTMADVIAAMDERHWEATLRRTASGRHTFPARSVPGRRLVEVAVHHVDLDVGRSRADWSPELAHALVDSLVPELRALGPLTLQAGDSGRVWRLDGGPTAPQDGRRDAGLETGGPEPVVRGTAADLAWWLTGRGPAGLSTDSPPLPDVPAR